MTSDGAADLPAASLGRDLAAASPVAIAGAAMSAVVVVVLGQLPPLLLNLAGGGLALSTQAQVGWLYTMAGHAVALNVSGTGSLGDLGSAAVTVRFGLLTIAVIVIAALVLAGRATARRVSGAGVRRAFAGSLIAIPYGIALGSINAVVDLRLTSDGGSLPEAVTIAASTREGFAVPAAVALVAGGLGGWSTASSWRSAAGTAVRAGLRTFASAMGLSVVALLMFAALRPDGLERYVSETTSGGPQRAALFLGHQALALPNGAIWILAPSLGGCVSTRSGEGAHDLICLDRLPRAPDPATWLISELGRIEGSSPVAPTPRVAVLFLAVPVAALVLGFRGAGRSAATTMRAAALGAAGGAVFATLVIVTSLSSSLWTRAVTGTGVRTSAIGPDPMSTAVLACVWGVAGGTLACVGWRLSRSARPR